MLVLASGNPHKFKEIREILSGLPVELRAQSDFNVATPPETGASFLENALLKARHAAQLTGLPVIAEDSGLEVDAIGGEPGIYSSRYAGEDADDDANIRKLLERMRDLPDDERVARFRCVAVYLHDYGDDDPIHVSAHWQGRIAHSPQGVSGFGYDPVFYLPEYGCTVAQLPAEEKNRASHRAQAFAQLRNRLQSDARLF